MFIIVYKGLLQSAPKKECVRHLVFILETMASGIQMTSDRTGNKVFSFTLIVDFDQYSMKELMYKPGMIFIQIVRENVM